MKSVLNYPRDYYWVSSLELADVLTEKEMRAEYSRLRSIAVKRLANLKKAGYVEDNFYKYNVNRYVPLADIKNDKQLMQKLSDIANFLSSRKSSVRERRAMQRDLLETMHEHGLTFVNKNNLDQFGEFMENFRQQKLDSLYSSDQAADLFGLAIEKNISKSALQKNFEEFLGEQERIKNVTRKRSERPMTAAELRRRLKQNEDRTDNSRRGRRGQSTGTSGKHTNSKTRSRKSRNTSKN